MRKLNFELKTLQKHAKENSFGTRAARQSILDQVANTLHDLGYRRMSAVSLKQKHVEALVNHWHGKGLGIGTIKNRMTHVRWWAEKIGKGAVVAKNNAEYGIMNRTYVTNTDKSRTLDDRINAIKDLNVKMSLELQAAFGLRREESIKFMPSYADKDSHISLKSTWTKGGKARDIPIRTTQQRELLDRARKLTGNGALIPSNKNYIQQLKTYERNTINAGFDKLHGLRHSYAQVRYEELTGNKCPIQGGASRQDLRGADRELDTKARLTISQELGHERLEIVAVYIGS